MSQDQTQPQPQSSSSMNTESSGGSAFTNLVDRLLPELSDVENSLEKLRAEQAQLLSKVCTFLTRFHLGNSGYNWFEFFFFPHLYIKLGHEAQLTNAIQQDLNEVQEVMQMVPMYTNKLNVWTIIIDDWCLFYYALDSVYDFLSVVGQIYA